MRLSTACGVATAALIMMTSATALGQTRVEAGLLDCTVAGGTGFVFGSTKDLTCIFKPAGGGAQETYNGRIRKFGVDVGRTTESYIQWLVLAPARGVPDGALAGRYSGVSAEASAGVGIGANVLVGGLDRSFALQPVSLQQQRGINVAAGIERMRLRQPR